MAKTESRVWTLLEARNEILQAVKKEFARVPDVWAVDDYLQHNPIVSRISTGSIMLDMALGFPRLVGFPLPSIAEIAGNPDSGKTFLTCSLGASAQMKDAATGNDGLVVFIDLEGTFNADMATKAGMMLDPTDFLYFQCETLEQGMSLIDKVIETHKMTTPGRCLLIILDSLAMMSTDLEKEAGIRDEAARATHARLLNKWLRLGVVRAIREHPIGLLIVNQLRATMATNPGAKKFDSFGGSGIKYGTRFRIHLTQGPIDKHATTHVAYSQRVIARIVKNKLVAPHREVEYDLRYETGVEDFYSVFDFLVDNKRLPKHGDKMIVWNNQNWYGTKLRDHMNQNPDDWLKMKHMLLDTVKDVWVSKPPPILPDLITPEQRVLIAPTPPLLIASTPPPRPV